ncbi:EamA family transporter [Yinghuangia seranimata]|nr:EamA family transporter [Yinghuangia seranimata]MDI2131041.1 EamA family transporter [Yinghuangia seranimata]
MGAVVPAAVLGAAVMHATWNALAHGMKDKLVGFTLMNIAYTACSAVLVCLVPLPHAAAWPYIAASAVLHVAYQALLLRAYELGDFGQMYPIARGTAPLLVAVVSATVLAEPLSPGTAAGVLVVSCGLVGLAFEDGLPRRAQLPALGAAAGTGVVIAAYTVVDGTGGRESGTVVGYLAWMFLCHAPLLILSARARRGRALAGQLRPALVPGLVGGVLSLIAYGVVIWAQTHGNLATVAALRETSILFAAVIGTVVFRERLGYLRLTAGAAVLTGVAVLAVAHA